MMSGEPSTVPFDPEQIAYVTRRYEALRGLSNASYGAGLLFAAVALSFLHASSAQPLSSLNGIMLAINFTPFAVHELECRYRATYGRTETPFEFATLASWSGLFVMIGAVMDMIIMDRAPLRWPSSAGIGLAISAGFVLLIDGRWRMHFLVPLCAAIAAIAMTAGVPPSKYFPSWESDPVRAPVLLLANAFVGLGLVTAGALDHRLLTRTLTPFHGTRGLTAVARGRSASLRTKSAVLVSGCALLTLCVPLPWMAIVLPMALMWSAIGTPLVRWVIRRVRGLPRPEPEAAQPFGLHTDTPIMFVLLAVAAVIDATFRGPAPVALTVAFALCSFWIALRDWPFRKYYLLGAFLPLALLPLAVRLEPARAFTVLLFVCAASLAIESHFDGRGGESSIPSTESEDADTL